MMFIMKHKILHVVSNSLGGVHTVLQEIIKGTIDKYDIYVLILGKSSDFDKQIQENIHLFKIGRGIYNLSSFSKLIKLIKEVDIVHVHLFPTLYYCAILSWLYKKNFIYTEHASVNNRRKYKILRFLEIPIYKSYNHIVAVSESCKRNLCAWLMNKVDVYTINNGINIENYKADSIFDFSKIGIHAKYVITMVARLSSDKDFHTLFDAMTLLNNDYHLVLVGDGELRKPLETEILKKELTGRVSLLGYRSDVANILAASTLSVLSSYAEGFSLVILESLILHIPCIGSHVDGIVDILPESYMFEQGDCKALADLIIKVANNDIERLQYDKILNTFSVQSMVNAYLNLYESSE